MHRFWVGLALVGLAACARRTEFIGRVQGDGARPAPAPGDVDARPGSDAPPEAAAAICPAADPTLPDVPEPSWNCGPRCWRDDAVDPALFAGAVEDPQPLRRPAILYPPAGSVHPLNLSHVTLQWRRGAPGQTAFRITIAGGSAGEPPFVLLVRYAPPVGTMIPAMELDASYRVPDRVWRFIARTHAGQEVALQVTAHDASTGTATSEASRIRFSPAAIEGGLYYLATERGAGIQRHVFGAGNVTSMVQPLSRRNPADCGGCHSVSRDGTTLAFAATHAGNLTIASTSDLDNPTFRPAPAAADRADAVAPVVSPDGKFILARHGIKGELTIYDVAGNRLGGATALETEGRIDFPEWSPDGLEIVATRASLGAQPDVQYSANDGQLVVLRFSPASFTLSRPEMIAPEPLEVHAYPSWSPDGRWIVFVSSPAGSGQSYNNERTRLRLVRRHSTGRPEIVDLGRANPDGALARSTFPKFAPTGQQDCRLLFVSFHSRMDYGLLRRNSREPEGGFQQLWLTAIDLDRLPADPSSPPVWLPFQDIDQKNVLATWSAKVPCASGCGAGAECRADRCVATSN